MAISVEYCKTNEERLIAKKLFAEIFSVEAFAERFYSVIDGRDDVDILLGKYNGEPVSVIHIVRAGNIAYLYGAGVLAKHRLKGIFRILVEETIKLCINNGAAVVFIVPQESYHYDIYKKFDVKTEVFKNTYSVVPDNGFVTEEINDAEEFYRLYCENNKSFLPLGFELFKLWWEENEKRAFFIVKNGEKCGYMICNGDEPYEIYCRYDGFYTVIGKEIFALAVENTEKAKEIYEAVYLD